MDKFDMLEAVYNKTIEVSRLTSENPISCQDFLYSSLVYEFILSLEPGFSLADSISVINSVRKIMEV